jgi:hypothetical protein
VTPQTGDGSGRHCHDEVVEFGADRSAGRRWLSRGLLACVVAAAVVTVALQAAGDHQARRAAKPTPPPPAVHVTAVGHRLLGVTAGWELFARGPDDLVQIQLARDRITQTYVPPLQSADPDVEFVIGAREVVIRSADLVPGYLVPDGGQPRVLAGPLAGGGPLVPGPAGAQAAWVASGSLTAPALSLVTLSGRRSGPSIRFPRGGPQVPGTAVSDGRGYVLVTTDSSFSVYDAGPGWDRPVPGTVVAVGPASWLVVTCDPQDQHCRHEVIDSATGSRRILPGPAPPDPYYTAWPPTGVIAPDGSTAAVAQTGSDGGLTVNLIDLHTGTTRDLGIPLGMPGTDLPLGADANDNSMAWSPDSRWLFIAEKGGKLVAVSALTGRTESLGISLPAIDQIAIRG